MANLRDYSRTEPTSADHLRNIEPHDPNTGDHPPTEDSQTLAELQVDMSRLLRPLATVMPTQPRAEVDR